METVFISELKPFLDAVAEQMDLYVPKKTGQGSRKAGSQDSRGAGSQHFVFSRYDPSAEVPVDFNNIRACMPVKEFLFPLRELAAVFPEPVEPEEIKPFAVLGLKDCDLRSLECLDQVFLEKDFEDPFYIARREKMFIISSDCFEPGESCFCNVLDGKPYPDHGFDLNVAQITEGYVIEIGSKKGKEFVERHSELFTEPSDESIAERDRIRADTAKQLEQNNAELRFDTPIRDMMTETYDSDVYDIEAETCVECQACTRVCPTCHCFYLYDTKQKDYFAKMKMWDSCMRLAYAQVAGGANPRKILGDRLRHRLMHKFVYFLDRYGLQMCIGCGRCVDAEAGDVDIRAVLKKLNEELKGRKEAKVAK
ncbi:MAG: 4Fe-4S dicluster domain-containing protein [Phycisphaerae bacterium]